MFDDVKLTKKAIFKCSDEDRARFSQSKPALAISVGQPAHENGDFMATLVSVNKNFQSCSIMVCDSLQRFSTKIYNPDKSMTEIHNEAKLEGNKWLERNTALVAELDIPYQIIRWDYWLNHPDYKHSYTKISHLYDNEQPFRQAIQDTTNVFLERKFDPALSSEAKNQAVKLSIEYLKEECAVVLLWAQYGYDVELYPTINLALDYIYNSILIKHIGIKIRNKGD